ncbi:glycosyl hydrolase 108 family protein [uncultured Campylobacter sp.]|uniref:glycosyl hydrolase 108 family protein n=1 Tax=uncultured Campylobacter sp. TaxID=218934 RepID=UPI0025EBDC61|nr:glycosyl hydrolase 108 family protein [uncultured Campylobacter sp.]
MQKLPKNTMANFNASYEILLRLEFNSPANVLHKNKGESGLTFMGIYESANPAWSGWPRVKSELNRLGYYGAGDAEILRRASINLYNDEGLKAAAAFYRAKFWDALRADEIKSQKIADEIFCFAVNVGIKAAVKTAQKVASELTGANLAIDGAIGAQTLRAINSCDADAFDVAFDEAERAYYDKIIAANPSLKIYARGWRNRAEAV